MNKHIFIPGSFPFCNCLKNVSGCQFVIPLTIDHFHFVKSNLNFNDVFTKPSTFARLKSN